MMDEIIAYAFDDKGGKRPMSLREIYEDCAQMLKIMYFDAMIRGHGSDATWAKDHIMVCVRVLLDNIDDKYADHIEDARKQIFNNSTSTD